MVMGIGRGPKAGKANPGILAFGRDGEIQSVPVKVVDGVHELICVIEVSFLSVRIVTLFEAQSGSK